ncbi:MAG: hypothetical protein A2836_02220 [Candidatus Taylorbacteria bacterium RIFCSPHIGHO2_01_FULL_45_63]|uniref:Carbamoyltransferase n=1 Tax=Candidatus Taylorbacteria bacterium RIFCSPHIGHO2_02_FULL_45_35 TaxID=1802311 RepID=A0A1G2MQI5_9BACT|nr:MAG: hypothetical protein A2836_02220 [Candidatus Taylorbacteria bacterium RIFCSPHIGHO2_01_FULL_45_63]OHA26157.1 MAG: hypothetical protein A3D56_00450 [Candidatus Taylorbacteria bacterium RIFCSPHIGHO2_02_FULL_45_35]OHA32505.1 MAG: hypothetical protein A3A22_00650 [Candidatus Taylorbacteria bacterium RIFCSPLOWO2_01_FULL_45_34b]
MANILGLKVTSHDTGAALIFGDRVIAISEERLNRVKHSRNMFPEKAIDYCLAAFKLSPADIDLVVLDQVGSRAESPSERIWKRNVGERFSKAALHVINHHDAHAASVFFASPFQEAAVLIVDGSGEKIHSHLGMIGTETETLYRGEGNVVAEIQKTVHVRRRLRFPYSMGIGKLYSLLSEGYLNFGIYNEGKMMGLAPYGDDRVLREFPFDRWFLEKNGHIICNPHVTFPGIERFVGTKKMRHAIKESIFRTLEKWIFWLLDMCSGRKKEFFLAPDCFKPIVLTKPARQKDGSPLDPYYTAVAYAGQKVLEEVMVLFGKKVKAASGSDNLCLAGGVGLNIDANKRFLDDVGFKHIFVQPAASDTGVALGCALWGAHMILHLPRFYKMDSASLGRPYSETEIEVALQERPQGISFRRSEHVASDAAKLIAKGNIIGWFQGGSEYGPRALGNRSILCDARVPDMKDIVNKRVKHREAWRPFAASILAERQREWFELGESSPFMLLAAQVVKEKQKLIPSVVHVDGSCRIQAVTSEANLPYYQLLKAFEKETGVPLFLNTSFNDAGEPIVETPKDAISCFFKTDLDCLVIGNYIVTKSL